MIEKGLQDVVGSEFVDDDDDDETASAASAAAAASAASAAAAPPPRDTKEQAKIYYIAKYIREVIDYVDTIKPLCRLFKLKPGIDYNEKTDVRLSRSKSQFSGITDTSVLLERLPLGIEILEWFDQWQKNCKKSADFFKGRESKCLEISDLIVELDLHVKTRQANNDNFSTFFKRFQTPFDKTIDGIECIMVEIRELRDTGAHVARMKKGRGELEGRGAAAVARPSPSTSASTARRNAWDTPPSSAPASPRPGSVQGLEPEPTSWVRPETPRARWAEKSSSTVSSPVTLPADLMESEHIARIRGSRSPTSVRLSSPRASSPDTSSRPDDADDLAAAARGRLKLRPPPTGAGAAVEGDNGDDAAREKREEEAIAAIEAEEFAAAARNAARKANPRPGPGPGPRPVQAPAMAPVPLATGQKLRPRPPVAAAAAPPAVAAPPAPSAPLPKVVNTKFIAERPDKEAREAAREEEWAKLSPEERRQAEALAAIEDEEIAEYEKDKKGRVSPGAGTGISKRPASASSAPAAPVVPAALPKSAAVQAAETRNAQLPAELRNALAGVKRPASASSAALAAAKVDNTSNAAPVVPSLQTSSPLTMSMQSMRGPIISPRRPGAVTTAKEGDILSVGGGGGSKKRTIGVKHKNTVKKNKTNAPRPKKATKKIVKYPKKRKFTIKIRQ